MRPARWASRSSSGQFTRPSPIATLKSSWTKGSFETGARARLFAGTGAVVQPHIDTGRFPGVRFVEDIEVAIAVEVGEFALVETVTSREDCFAKAALAVAVKNPCLGLWIIRVGSLFGPLRHFSSKNVEMPVAVHVANIEGVAMNHVALEQIVSDPVAFFQRVTHALIPAQWAGPVTRRYHNLRVLRGLDNFPGTNAPADDADLDGLEFAVAEIFEPVIAREQIDDAVAVDIDRGRALGVFECATLITPFARLPGIDRFEYPRFGLDWVGRDVRDVKRVRALIPKNELRPAGVFEVAKYLVVVLGLAAFFDHM